MLENFLVTVREEISSQQTTVCAISVLLPNLPGLAAMHPPMHPYTPNSPLLTDEGVTRQAGGVLPQSTDGQHDHTVLLQQAVLRDTVEPVGVGGRLSARGQHEPPSMPPGGQAYPRSGLPH